MAQAGLKHAQIVEGDHDLLNRLPLPLWRWYDRHMPPHMVKAVVWLEPRASRLLGGHATTGS